MSDMTNLWHKIIFKRGSEKKEEKLFILVKIVENQTPIGYYYKYTK
jgi:hypothetical protein